MSNYNITFTTASAYDVTPGNDPGMVLPGTNLLDYTLTWSSVERVSAVPVVENYGFTGGTLYQVDLNLRRPSAGQLFPR